jgi:tetratricopeptide (TPR) repeat protein
LRSEPIPWSNPPTPILSAASGRSFPRGVTGKCSTCIRESLPPAEALAVATAATRLGSLETGESLATSALGGFRQRADDDGRMRCLNLLGAIAYERGSLDDASERFASSLDLSRGLADLQSTARASNNLGSVAYLRGRVEESRSLFREALLAYQRLGDRRGLAETYHNLGIVARESGEIEDATRAAEQAVRHAQVSRDPALIALAMTGKAETAIADGVLEVTREDLDRAEEFAVQAGDELGAGEVNRVRAIRWLRLGELERALEAAMSARATAQRFGSTQIQGECAALAARAARRLGRTEQATGLFGEAQRLFHSLGAVLHLARLLEEEESQ